MKDEQNEEDEDDDDTEEDDRKRMKRTKSRIMTNKARKGKAKQIVRNDNDASE